MKITENEKMLLRVAKKIPAEFQDQIVFLGGAIIGCLITDAGIGDIRNTQDVDLVVGIKSRVEFQKFEEKLRRAGFSPSMEEDAPICRWRVDNVSVDIMPCNADILGFSNRWYKSAVEDVRTIVVEDVAIRIVSAPYFLATKVEAFLGCGRNDFLGSSDMEDIVTLIDGRKELIDEIRNSELGLQEYLRDIFQKWLKDRDFLGCLAGHSTAGPANKVRTEDVKRVICEIAGVGVDCKS